MGRSSERPGWYSPSCAERVSYARRAVPGRSDVDGHAHIHAQAIAAVRQQHAFIGTVANATMGAHTDGAAAMRREGEGILP